jgi:DNA gyrase subunit A
LAWPPMCRPTTWASSSMVSLRLWPLLLLSCWREDDHYGLLMGPTALRGTGAGVLALIDNPDLPDDRLLRLIPAPDFPTGGDIMGRAGPSKFYTTGQVAALVQAGETRYQSYAVPPHAACLGGWGRHWLDNDPRQNVYRDCWRSGAPDQECHHRHGASLSSQQSEVQSVVLSCFVEWCALARTEASSASQAALLEKIADMVNDKKLDGISDLRDESDRDGIRVVRQPVRELTRIGSGYEALIGKKRPDVHPGMPSCQVIELKRDAVPTLVENNLFKKTPLQTTFSGNLLALSNDGRQPQRLTLRDALKTFISFRFQVGLPREAFPPPHRSEPLPVRPT